MKNINEKIKRALWFLRCRFNNFGKKSLIDKPMVVSGKKYIKIGNNVTIKNSARIECIDCFNDKEFKPELIIGNNCIFEQGAHIISTDKLHIGNDCLISARFFVTTCHHSYNEVDVPIIRQELISRPVGIGNNCFIGMDVKVFPGVKIGNNCIIGANSIVTTDIPSYSVAVGAPAKIIKKYNFETKKWEKEKN